MYIPKSEIFNILSTLSYNVSQAHQSVFNTLPSITFRVEDNSIDLDLDNIIQSQNIIVIIDIWAEDSITASQILKEVENKMRENNYSLVTSKDVPNNDEIYHIYSRFFTIK